MGLLIESLRGRFWRHRNADGLETVLEGAEQANGNRGKSAHLTRRLVKVR
jgi:hypothetical protein